MSANTNNTDDSTDTMTTNREEVAGLDMEPGPETDEEFHGIPVREDVGHPLVPEGAEDYVMRPLDFSETEPAVENEDSFGTVRDVDLIAHTILDDRYSTMLIGDTGVGKNAAVKYLAAGTQNPAPRLNFGIGTSYEDLIGSYAPTEDGHFEFKPGILTQAVKNGWWFIADEINAAPPEVMLPLNEITEPGEDRTLTIPETSEVIEPHPNFRFIATMNPQEYAGRQKVEEAFKNRFYPIELDYLEPRAEIGLLKERTNIERYCTDSQIEALVEVANDIRAQRAGECNTKISLRDLMRVASFCELMSLREATRAVLLPAADPADKDAIREVISTNGEL